MGDGEGGGGTAVTDHDSRHTRITMDGEYPTTESKSENVIEVTIVK